MDASVCTFLNFLGFILSAATAYVYEFVHRAEDIEERCIVHLTTSLAVTEFVIFINAAFENASFYVIRDVSPIATTFALSSFLWSLILAFQVRKKFTSRLDDTSKDSKSIPDDTELMKKYLLIGYGIPFLVFTCYLGGLRNDARDWVMQSTILADVAIIIINGLIFFNVSSNLLRQIDNVQASLPVKLDVKQAKHRQQFANGLFLILVLPWFILLIVTLVISPVANYSVLQGLVWLGPPSVIGLQGICLFFNLVLHHERIWTDLESEYGWKKPDELKMLDKALGYTSEDDDNDQVTNCKTRWDLLAKIYYMMKKKNSTEEGVNQLPNPKVYSEKATQSMQPAIHHYVGCGVLPGGPNHTEATRKLMNETV